MVYIGVIIKIPEDALSIFLFKLLLIDKEGAALRPKAQKSLQASFVRCSVDIASRVILNLIRSEGQCDGHFFTLLDRHNKFLIDVQICFTHFSRMVCYDQTVNNALNLVVVKNWNSTFGLSKIGQS